MPKINLEKLNKTNYEELAEIANNYEIWKHVRDIFPHPYSLEDAKFFIDNIAAKQDLLIRGVFYNGQLAGVIGIHPQNDIYRKSAELGYWLGQNFWGKGIATEAVSQIIDQAFSTFDINRIFACVFEYNLASKQVLIKNGFKYEGTSIKAVFKNDQFYDEHRYALIK